MVGIAFIVTVITFASVGITFIVTVITFTSDKFREVVVTYSICSGRFGFLPSVVSNSGKHTCRYGGFLDIDSFLVLFLLIV